VNWSLARLRPLQIALVSVVYWLGLAAVKLGSAIVSAWWVSRLSPNHGAITAGLKNTTLFLTISQDGKPLWSGSTSLVQLGVITLGPPLLLWLTARWAREVENAGPAPNLHGPREDAVIPPPDPTLRWPGERADDPDRTRVVEPRPGRAEPRP
jgi:hypothetical protein